MWFEMFLELIEDIAKLAFIVGSLYFALNTFIHYKQPTLSNSLHRRRLTILFALILAITTLKVTEDVLGGESGPVDEAILLFIHSHISTKLTGVFEAITLTGSLYVLIPLSFTATIVMLLTRMRYDALLLVASLFSAALVVYVVKMAVGRVRPALWDTEWYWGASFPSGHTLLVAAFATSIALIIDRHWPTKRSFIFSIAFIWIVLVALSRLVLGVHWPTDVLAAMCIGVFLPLVLSALIKLRYA